jgi:hypothetical protein
VAAELTKRWITFFALHAAMQHTIDPARERHAISDSLNLRKKVQSYISELSRLYLPTGASPPDELPRQAISLVTHDGFTRAMVIDFPAMADADEAAHWTLLCKVANALQAELGLPAPAVSVSGTDGYSLWLSLETPAPTAQVQEFLERLRLAYFPSIELRPDAASAAVALPPCLNTGTGKWTAFIHPGLGASFANDPGLEMAPPLSGQTALLDGLRSISEAQLLHAMTTLKPAQNVAAPSPAGLLLKDATLEDIVRHLHAKHIEPTFRHLIQR